MKTIIRPKFNYFKLSSLWLAQNLISLCSIQVGIYSVVQILGGLLAALSAVTIFGKSANLAVTPGYGALVTQTPGSVVGNMLLIMWMPCGCCTYCTCACDISVGFYLFFCVTYVSLFILISFLMVIFQISVTDLPFGFKMNLRMC